VGVEHPWRCTWTGHRGISGRPSPGAAARRGR
jgi:hypothetical protein